MLKRFLAVFVALFVPFVIFIIVIGLNESDLDLAQEKDKDLSFDVTRQQQIQKPKPPPQKEQKRRQSSDQLPSMKPSRLGSDIGGGGLSFGVPQFDEARFEEIADNSLLDNTVNRTMDNDAVDTPPKVRKRSPIVYPELARRQGISGFVSMNLLIDEEGNVEDVEIIESKPKEIFDLKADSTVRRWKFEPATYNGRKVKVWAMQKIVFKLD